MARRRSPRGAGAGRLGPLLLLAALLALLLRPPPRPPLSAEVARLALSQVGQVDYFWGGKSRRLGPDPRWGMLKRVTSAGSDSTGALLPYGLDCSGLVSWAAVNATGRADAYEGIGDGVRGQYARCRRVPWSAASVGDLCFFPGLSHVGIVVGLEDGRVRVVHASKSLGGVVLSEDAAAVGFTQIGRPRLYGTMP